jgi:hypothetical protein
VCFFNNSFTGPLSTDALCAASTRVHLWRLCDPRQRLLRPHRHGQCRPRFLSSHDLFVIWFSLEDLYVNWLLWF